MSTDLGKKTALGHPLIGLPGGNLPLGCGLSASRSHPGHRPKGGSPTEHLLTLCTLTEDSAPCGLPVSLVYKLTQQHRDTARVVLLLGSARSRVDTVVNVLLFILFRRISSCLVACNYESTPTHGAAMHPSPTSPRTLLYTSSTLHIQLSSATYTWNDLFSLVADFPTHVDMPCGL